MNERIKELIDQATTIEEHGWGASYANFDKEKFAALVAAHEREECAKIADVAGPYQCADLIRARGTT